MSDPFYGSEPYMAPEVYSEYDYTFSVDMWSIGCLIFFMLFGYPPIQSGINYLNDVNKIC
jgi:serine/threonine protein kinase